METVNTPQPIHNSASKSLSAFDAISPSSSLQQAVNNSPRVQQLKSLQAAANNSPQNRSAMQLQTAVNGGGVVQMKKSQVLTWVKSHRASADRMGLNRTNITYINVLAAVNNEAYSKIHRRVILKKWNTDQTSQYRIEIPKDLKRTKTLDTSAKRRIITRPDSPRLSEISYFDTWDQKKEASEIKVLNSSNANVLSVPLLSSIPEATEMTRLYGHAFAESSGKITGAQFAVKTGEYFGLYDAPQGNDLVFVNLEAAEKREGYLRSSSIANWATIAKRLKEEFSDYAELKRQILMGLEGGSVSENEVLREAIGAISCDAKNSITGWAAYIEDFRNSKEKDPAEWFWNGTEGHEPVYMPTQGGGRKLPGVRKAEILAGEAMEESEKSVSEEEEVDTTTFMET